MKANVILAIFCILLTVSCKDESPQLPHPNIGLFSINLDSLKSIESDLNQIQNKSIKKMTGMTVYSSKLHKDKTIKDGNIRYFFFLDKIYSYCIVKQAADSIMDIEKYNKSTFSHEIKVDAGSANKLLAFTDKNISSLLLIIGDEDAEAYCYFDLSMADSQYKSSLKSKSELALTDIVSYWPIVPIISSLGDFK